MRSTPADDATTRARIRDTAIRLFGRDGFRPTTVRAIAEATGVSPGLVIHHFGSKEGLRRACDKHILALTTAQGDEIGASTATGRSGGGAGAAHTSAIGSRASTTSTSSTSSTASTSSTPSTPSTSEVISRWLTDVDANRPWLDYLSRSMTDESALGDRLFDEFVDYTERMFASGVQDGSVRESHDPRMRAVLLTAYGLSALIFERHIGRAIGEPGMNSATARRMAIPALELFTNGLYTSDTLLRAAHDAIDTRDALDTLPDPTVADRRQTAPDHEGDTL